MTTDDTLGPVLAPGTPIVVFGDDWGRHVSTMQHLFRHLTADYPVIWVNAIGHRVPSLSRQDVGRVAQKLKALAARGRSGSDQGGSTSSTSRAAEPSTPPLRVIQPRVLPWHHLGPVRAFNSRSLVGAIRASLAECGLTAAPLLVTGSPPSVSVFGRLGEYGSAYLCMDDFLHLPNVSAHMIAPLERELLERVDVLVATAQALVESKRPRSGRAHHLPQGVNFEHFSAPRPVPAELAGLPRPIIGFAGGIITPPLDLELIRRLADAHPGGSVVLVGPVQADLASIARPNVHVLGRRPYADLPAYVQAFDVGLIPYVLNEHTIAVDPLKLLEYLAAGVAVVSTDLPEVRKYEDSVLIARDSAAFVAAVGRALGDPADSRASRQAVAEQHGWSSRAARLKRILGGIRVQAAN